MPQLLLFPDPRPLVERLGADFFRQAPECPGVYLMRDAADAVLYVGKARNLRRRLGSYRVANPDRLRRRHLRLLRAVTRIELERCPDESSALARESELLRALRPRFNRAGTWPAPSRFLVWSVTEAGLDMDVATTSKPEERRHGSSPALYFGPLGAFAFPFRAALVRLLWCVTHPDRGLAAMPAGWFHSGRGRPMTIPRPRSSSTAFEELEVRLRAFFSGEAEAFVEWLRKCTAAQTHPFELVVRELDLETLLELARAHAFPPKLT
jgi:predicted GIY-YIG superfamily endonuclease